MIKKAHNHYDILLTDYSEDKEFYNSVPSLDFIAPEHGFY